MATILVRNAELPDDRLLLWEMLYAASFAMDEPKPPRGAVNRPEIRRYLWGWGRPGDHALVAECQGHRVGAAWYRLFPTADPGYGFVDEHTPELSIAVAPRARGHGIGRLLLDRLHEVAREDGFTALSLSVGRSNTAARSLYERCGFEVVQADDGHGGMTMRAGVR